MSFSREVIGAAWKRAGGKCECTQATCPHHTGRHGKALDPQNRTEGMDWDAHHVVSQRAGGSDGLQNCLILCVPCHEHTKSYGRSA